MPTSLAPSDSSAYLATLVQPAHFPPLPAGWNTTVETLTPIEGVTLFLARHRAPTSSATAGSSVEDVLLVVHGFGEHGGRYLHVPHYLREVVNEVVCLDQRGHGRSSGLRGHIEDFDIFAGDVAFIARYLMEEGSRKNRKIRLHLLGHSLGGHIALRTLFLHPDLGFQSAAISAPFLAIAAPVPAIKKFAARALNSIWGSLQLSTDIDASHLSHDRGVSEAYLSDRLVHGKMTPRFFSTMSRAFVDTLARREGLRVPTLFLIPLEDRVVSSDVTLGFFGQLNDAKKRLKTYPQMYHEILNETDRQTVFTDLAGWIREHQGSKTT